MGIDINGLDAILLGTSVCEKRGTVLTLGKQDIHITPQQGMTICQQYGIPAQPSWFEKGTTELMRHFGFQSLESLDKSAYEGATLLHDMNMPLPPELVGRRFDFIFDGGTTEHIFNVAQVFQNTWDLLAVGGIFVSVTVNNNLSGHGLYQFSPEFFKQICSPRYGMQLKGLWLGKIGSTHSSWREINNPQVYEFKFGGDDRVYVITIAKKVSEGGGRFLENPPQQGNYEETLWLR
jgi:hypothetical protein